MSAAQVEINENQSCGPRESYSFWSKTSNHRICPQLTFPSTSLLELVRVATPRWGGEHNTDALDKTEILSLNEKCELGTAL